jgi:type VI secretion system protein ImpF
MKAFVPGLLDRLMGERGPGSSPGSGSGAARASIEQLKESVARDLEALLNTRLGFAPDRFDGCPEARASILTYGLADCAAYCLSSSEDRAAICASLKDAIERHEPRLKNVSATLERETGSVNRLSFVINATLLAADGEPVNESVNFSAVLQPSSLHYAVARTVRPRS